MHYDYNRLIFPCVKLHTLAYYRFHIFSDFQQGEVDIAQVQEPSGQGDADGGAAEEEPRSGESRAGQTAGAAWSGRSYHVGVNRPWCAV